MTRPNDLGENANEARPLVAHRKGRQLGGGPSHTLTKPVLPTTGHAWGSRSPKCSPRRWTAPSNANFNPSLSSSLYEAI